MSNDELQNFSKQVQLDLKELQKVGVRVSKKALDAAADLEQMEPLFKSGASVEDVSDLLNTQYS